MMSQSNDNSTQLVKPLAELELEGGQGSEETLKIEEKFDSEEQKKQGSENLLNSLREWRRKRKSFRKERKRNLKEAAQSSSHEEFTPKPVGEDNPMPETVVAIKSHGEKLLQARYELRKARNEVPSRPALGLWEWNVIPMGLARLNVVDSEFRPFPRLVDIATECAGWRSPARNGATLIFQFPVRRNVGFQGAQEYAFMTIVMLADVRKYMLPELNDQPSGHLIKEVAQMEYSGRFVIFDVIGNRPVTNEETCDDQMLRRLIKQATSYPGALNVAILLEGNYALERVVAQSPKEEGTTLTLAPIRRDRNTLMFKETFTRNDSKRETNAPGCVCFDREGYDIPPIPGNKLILLYSQRSGVNLASYKKETVVGEPADKSPRDRKVLAVGPWKCFNR